MKLKLLLAAIAGCVTLSQALAQDKDKLFGTGEVRTPKSGFMLNANGGIDFPAADMANRFGTSYRLGPALLYKTTSNWIFGAKFDFIVGNKIREDSLMINITDKYSEKSGNLYEFIDMNGQRTGIPVFQRGYAVGLQVGKIISFNKRRPDNGLLLLTTAGFMQYRINIFDRNKAVAQLLGDYVKGYDRLTNGAFVEQYAGYVYFAKNRLLNFTVGADVLFGFTQGRRDYLYDVMRPDTKSRLDMLYGLRIGWYIPMFHRKSEEIMFE